MCQECSKNIETLNGIFSGLIEQWSPMSNDPWTISDPMTVGGPQGVYVVRSPFNAGFCQWKVETISDGGATVKALVSPSRITDLSSVPGISVGDSGTSENSPIIGLLLNAPSTGGQPPVNSEWYNTFGNPPVVYVAIVTTGAAYVTIAFRVKR